MEVKIANKTENSLLGRIEVTGIVDFEGTTPSNAQVAESLAKEFKTDIAQVVMKKVYTKFSQQEADFLAFVYKSEEERMKVERVTKHMKKKIEEARKKAEEEAKANEEKAAKAVEEKKAVEEVATEPAAEEPKEE
jgi:ribosomal protein S24E